MEQYKSIICLIFTIYATLLGVFYIVAGSLLINAGPDVTLFDQIQSMYFYEVYFARFTIAAGAIVIVAQVINFLWLFNVTSPTKWHIVFSSMLLDTVVFGCFMSVGVIAACLCNYYEDNIKIKVLPILNTKFSENNIAILTALAVTSFVGNGMLLLCLGLKAQTYVEAGKSVADASVMQINV